MMVLQKAYRAKLVYLLRTVPYAALPARDTDRL